MGVIAEVACGFHDESPPPIFKESRVANNATCIQSCGRRMLSLCKSWSGSFRMGRLVRQASVPPLSITPTRAETEDP